LNYNLLTKEVEAHIRVGLVFALLGWGGGLSWGSLLSNWSGTRKSGWIGQVSLGLLGSLETDIGGAGDSNKLLESVGNAVWGGGDGWVANVQGSGGNIVDSLHESLSDVLLGDVEDFWVENASLLEALLADETVAEWRDFEHVQEGGLGLTDLLAGFQQRNVGHDFNATSSDFGLDVQGLEEAGLLWTETGVLSFDSNINWGDGAGSSWGGNLVGLDLVSDVFEIAVGEDKTDVLDQKWEDLLVGWELVKKASNDLLHHSVLAHDDGGFASELSSDVGELKGGHIIGVYKEKLGVVSDGAFELLEVVGFPGLSGIEFLAARHFLEERDFLYYFQQQ